MSLHPPSRISILGVPIDVIECDAILDLLTPLMMTGRPHAVFTVNSLMIMEAQNSLEFLSACQDASMCIPESSGVTWAAHCLGHKNVERYPGVDLALDLCGRAAQQSLPVYLLGGMPGVAGQAARALNRHHPTLQISGMRDGYFQLSDEKSIINDIHQSHARLVLVGLGMPKQELWIVRNLQRLPPAVYIGVGGSMDVWAGRSRRAPFWVRKAGLEWVYRFQQEPFRWKRIVQLPKFVLKILIHRLGKH